MQYFISLVVMESTRVESAETKNDANKWTNTCTVYTHTHTCLDFHTYFVIMLCGRGILALRWYVLYSLSLPTQTIIFLFIPVDASPSGDEVWSSSKEQSGKRPKVPEVFWIFFSYLKPTFDSIIQHIWPFYVSVQNLCHAGPWTTNDQ